MEFVLCGGWGPVTLGDGCGIVVVFVRFTRAGSGEYRASGGGRREKGVNGDALLPLTLISI